MVVGNINKWRVPSTNAQRRSPLPSFAVVADLHLSFAVMVVSKTSPPSIGVRFTKFVLIGDGRGIIRRLIEEEVKGFYNLFVP